ncbi:MAG: hypothetical protein KGO02_08395 [Alphaproteobacteria bacterium]|nr:hypothetical protein [Alphaproteobacteria bacterium]
MTAANANRRDFLYRETGAFAAVGVLLSSPSGSDSLHRGAASARASKSIGICSSSSSRFGDGEHGGQAGSRLSSGADRSGRSRRDLAPQNTVVLPSAFLNDSRITIG